MRKIKKDKYFRDRGNTYVIIGINCAKCGKEILLYQKDGRGALKRLYFNRILSPESLASLQDITQSPKQIKLLSCSCGGITGIPMMHWEGRLAFKLVPGSFKKNKLLDK